MYFTGIPFLYLSSYTGALERGYVCSIHVHILFVLIKHSSKSRANHEDAESRLDHWFEIIVKGDLYRVVLEDVGAKDSSQEPQQESNHDKEIGGHKSADTFYNQVGNRQCLIAS
mmetsp:Transcript_28903/g.52896  ORF Transcript_28903/g.52896 Transcript_28903/m.52896 type:complete len:114 (+) Transcript_28903:1208-1549(+)